MAQQVKSLPATQETQEMQVRSLGQKSPWSRKWQASPVFLPGNPMDRGPWWFTVHGVAELYTTEWLNTHTHTHTHSLKEVSNSSPDSRKKKWGHAPTSELRIRNTTLGGVGGGTLVLFFSFASSTVLSKTLWFSGENKNNLLGKQKTRISDLAESWSNFCRLKFPCQSKT